MTIATLVLALYRLGHPAAGPADAERARLLAVVITEEATRNDIDPVLVAALIARESSFDPRAVGKAGERGLMQLLPTGSALAHHRHLAPAALESPRINIALGVAHMARVRALCGATPPAAWLSVYAGNKRCRPTRYSRAIVEAAAGAARGATVHPALARSW